jgi:K+-sensing histidine kinase KdpD
MAELDPKQIAASLGLEVDDVPQEELTNTVLAALVERNELLHRLTKIQRSISHRAPLQDVLDAITAGASDLLGAEVVGLEIVDPENPDRTILRSASGLELEMVERVRHGNVGEGAGGRAVKENQLVIIYDYANAPGAAQPLAEARLQAAMAAPVHERGQVTGSLIVASFEEGRRYSKAEQDILVAFADHVSLALTDAKTLQALREAQQAKDMFFAMASHELKTPLTVIMGTLRTIEKHHEALTGHVRGEMLSSAYQRGRELKDLIDRMLQGARAELAGTRRQVFLPDLVRDAVKGFDEHRVRVGDVPTTSVETDDVAVRDLVGVFLENAFAHAPEDTEIAVETAIDLDRATITVTNEGKLPEDIAPEDLFQPFRRGIDVTPTGVGLGLYIASRLADAIDGRIDVESLNGSVAFTVSFPTGAVTDSAS